MTPDFKDTFHYLLITPQDRLWDLWVTAAGSQFVPPDRRFEPTGHSPTHNYLWRHGRTLNEYAVVYVVRGQGEFESRETGSRVVNTGDAILLFPNVWHRYRQSERTGWNTHWVTFQGPWADRLRQHGVLRPSEPLLHPGLDELILRPFTSLLDRAGNPSLGLQPLLATDVMSVLAAIQSAVQRRQTGGAVHDAVRRAKAILEASSEPPSLADLAEGAGLGRSRFHEVFKQCTGASPYQYHLHLRMSRARELLRGSSLSVKEIAATLQFPSVYQFSRMFRKKVGISPTQYRSGGHESVLSGDIPD